MLVYKIISNGGQDDSSTLSPKPCSPKDKNFREITFKRSLAGCRIKVDDRVKLRGTPKKGKVRAVYQDAVLVEWENNRPMYIEVQFDDGSINICNPGQLKRSTR